MVRTIPTYDPPLVFAEGGSSLIHLNLRILTREGEVIVDFGEFQDILSYNDNLSVESPAGSWNIKMRALLSNEQLLQKIHPGMVVEVFGCRNDDPLIGVQPEEEESEDDEEEEDDTEPTCRCHGLPLSEYQPGQRNPPDESGPVFAEGTTERTTEAYAPIDGKPGPPPPPQERDYLDLAPYLLMRGITSSYGRNSSVIDGSGAETSLTLSGESYGAVYRNCQVLVDRNAPTAIGKELQTRLQTQDVFTIVPLYYGLLWHWVEEFWGEPTGWEALTRPIPVPPDIFVRINEGNVWSVLQSLSCQGIFHIFVDHTGAICWEKLPWSSRCDALIDEFMEWSEGHTFRNWEDLPIVDCPSDWVQSWADRLSCDRLSNYLRVQMTQMGGGGGSDSTMDAGQVYNMGSIRQYGGPRRLEVQVPMGTVPYATYGEVQQTEADSRVTEFVDRAVMEIIRWYDRPVQRMILQVRGDAGWRIGTRIRIIEDWHNLEAEPVEYYVLSRSHNINIQGSWTTQLECLRDRRTRYLGIGLRPVEPQEVGTDQDGILAPVEPDEYWRFDRSTGAIELVEDYDAFVEPWRPECPEEDDEEPEVEADE